MEEKNKKFPQGKVKSFVISLMVHLVAYPVSLVTITIASCGLQG